MSKSTLQENVQSPFEAKALACLEAVRLGVELRFPKVVIEGDSLKVIKKCSTIEINRSVLSPIIQTIKSISSLF